MEKVIQVKESPSVLDTVSPSKIPQEKEELVKKFDQSNGSDKKNKMYYALASVIVVLAGIGTGWFLSGTGFATDSSTAEIPQQGEVGVKGDVNGDEVGTETENADTAEGELKEGGIDGEGTHHLDRNAGPEKNVYLVSTTINLQNFVGKKVQVWGQTVAGKKAGWLMDVVKVKVVK